MISKLTRIFLFVSLLVLCSGSSANKFQKGLTTHIQARAQETTLKSSKPEEEKDLYVKHCLTCHQTDGSGVPNMFPPIRKSDWVNGDKNKLINVLLNGLQGDIDVNGEPFSQLMPKQDSLTDVQIAKLLTYIRQNFENKADTIQPSDVKNLREKK